MKLLKIAVESGRMDLAAHTIVLAAVKVLNQGVKPDAKQNKTKKGSAKR